MPIYAYKCSSCGFAKDVLQKMSDTPLEVCPSCGQPAFKKQLTAAGFQLKGSGWYVTDFKSSGSAPAAAVPKPASEGAEAPASTPSAPVIDTGKTPASTPAASGSAPSAD
jgi:putative FmdB family regulatory protein